MAPRGRLTHKPHQQKQDKPASETMRALDAAQKNLDHDVKAIGKYEKERAMMSRRPMQRRGPRGI